MGIFSDKENLQDELEENNMETAAETAFSTGRDAGETAVEVDFRPVSFKEKKKIGDKVGFDNVRKIF